MALNKQSGNMYGFVTHTYNPVKGRCSHLCSYCYMRRWGEQKPIRLDEKELKTDLGENNYVFVGSSTDMFAADVPREWIKRVLAYCKSFRKNKYLFQTKNPQRFVEFENCFPKNTMLCVTLESDRIHKEMGKAPYPVARFEFMKSIKGFDKMVTIEPIMRFNPEFIEWIERIDPVQVNIGADSKGHGLPEPSAKEVNGLIWELEKFTSVHLKDNLKRLTGEM